MQGQLLGRRRSDLWRPTMGENLNWGRTPYGSSDGRSGTIVGLQTNLQTCAITIWASSVVRPWHGLDGRRDDIPGDVTGNVAWHRAQT